MRVLLIASEVPPVVSGLARVTSMLADGLEARGHHVDSVSAADYPRAVFGEFRFSGFAAGWSSLAPTLPRYDVVNVHGPAPTLSDAFLGLVRTTPRQWRPPIVYTHHFDIDLEGLGALCKPYNWFTRRLARSADEIVVSTPSYASIMEGHGPNVSIVPWARPPVGTIAEDTSGKDRDGPLKILFVGQMRPYKGLPALLEAVGRESRLELTIVGDGPELDEYKDSAREMCPSASFVGRIDDEQLQRLYAASHVIALPSLRRVEAFGLVLLEGMAAGCVPVASDLPGVRDVASPTGVVVPPGDVSALRNALTRLADDRTMVARLGSESIEFASQFTETRFLSATEEILERKVMEKQRLRMTHPLPVADRTVMAPSLTQLDREFDTSWSSVMWFDARSHDLHQAWGHAARISQRARNASIARYVAQRNEPMLIDTLVGGGSSGRFRDRPGVGSAIASPIFSSDGFVGVVSMTRSSAKQKVYSEVDAKMLGARLRAEGRRRRVLQAIGPAPFRRAS